jgi:hypothetical protein
MKRILVVLTVALVLAATMSATAVPAFAQGRGEGAQGPAVGPEGGNPGQLDKQQGRTVGAQDMQPLPFGGTEPEAGFINAPPGVVCTAPGSPFFAGGC